jgi:oxygen-independent coproporphyrinogen-3 oxidase
LNSNSGLYIHIPFCENFCPYCPYYKIRYNKDTALEYKKALIKEIDLYYEMFGPVTFSSLYIGGGTPTLMTDEIGEVLEHINKRFKIKGSLGIETNPRNIDKDTARKLKSLGFNLISLGIQSFNNDVLRKIGRNYNSDTAMNSLGDVLAENFDTVNLDMMFVIDGQTIDDIESDLTKAIKNNVDQIILSTNS